MANLDFGAAFSRVFDLYGKFAVPLLIWSAVFQGLLALVVSVFLVSVLTSGGIALLATPVVIALGIVASALMTGAYIVGLDEAERTGTFPSFGSVWPRVTPRLGALVVTSILAALGVLLGLIALVVPGFILMTWWAVAAPVVMLEGHSGTAALGRSRDLVRGNGWTVFGLLIVTGIITSIVTSIVGSIVSSILGGDDTIIGSFGGQFVGGTIIAPVGALLAIVMYEALSGRTSPGPDIADPNLPPPGAQAPGNQPPAQQPPVQQPPAQQPPASPEDPRSGPFV